MNPTYYEWRFCDEGHESFGQQEHGSLDFEVTQHNLHCPDCDRHLTSSLLCPHCGTRWAFTYVDMYARRA